MDNNRKHDIRFLLFSASLRKDSLNTKLIKLAARRVQENGGIVDYADMKEFDCPSYNQELQDGPGFPSGATNFKNRIEANDAIIISCPEYNFSMPGLIKNAIDWVSRFKPQPFNEHHVLLMSASPSMAGGNRGLWTLRVPLEHLGARVFPDMYSLAMAHQAFDANGDIANAPLAQRFTANVTAFMSLVEAAKNYPCMKKAWVEFLGEKPEAAVEK